MKSIKETKILGGQLYISFDMQQWHKAYTIAEFTAQRGRLGHAIANRDYVRQCYRREVEHTGRVATLPYPWECIKHGRLIYVFNIEIASVKSRFLQRTIAWGLDPATELRLHSSKAWAALLDEHVKVTLIFSPNGSITYNESVNIDSKKAKLMSAVLPFLFTWQGELLRACSVNADTEMKAQLTQFSQSRDGQIALLDFHKRCLYCGEYKPSGMRAGAKFCSESHRELFREWKDKIVSKHRGEILTRKYTPHERLREIMPMLT